MEICSVLKSASLAEAAPSTLTVTTCLPLERRYNTSGEKSPSPEKI